MKPYVASKTSIILNISDGNTLRIVNAILYWHIWIAAAALAMYWQTQWLVVAHIRMDASAGFIFCSTCLLYNVHRLASLQHTPTPHNSRLAMAAQHRRASQIMVALSAPLAFICYAGLPSILQWLLVLPIFLSIAYALPVLPRRHRLRDLPYLKIFVLASVWTWMTTYLPLLPWNAPAWTIVAERFCFIFAIALAFDIRDHAADARTGVSTLPLLLGIKNTKLLAVALLLLCITAAAYTWQQGHYTYNTFTALVCSAVFCGILIVKANINGPDWYYNGLLDGQMLLQSVLVWLF
jgi:4-hydroxybenzoate polyprenyltransferase